MDVARLPRVALSLDLNGIDSAHSTSRAQAASTTRDCRVNPLRHVAEALSKGLLASNPRAIDVVALGTQAAIGQGGFGRVYLLPPEIAKIHLRSSPLRQVLDKMHHENSRFDNVVVKDVMGSSGRHQEFFRNNQFLVQSASSCLPKKTMVVNQHNVEQTVLKLMNGRQAPKLLGVILVDGQQPTEPGHKQILMSKVDGMPLSKLQLGNEDITFGANYEDRLVIVIRSALQAIDRLHSLGYCHNDIKPDNIIVNSDGGISLIDFGLTSPADQPHFFGQGAEGTYPAFEDNLTAAKVDLHGLRNTVLKLLECDGRRVGDLASEGLRACIGRLNQEQSGEALPINSFTSAREALESL